MIRKTAAVTAASIAGVLLAGTAAVGANIGILNAADDNRGLGTLSADAAIAAPADAGSTTSSTTIRPSTVTATEVSDDEKVQTFAVDAAGTVEVEVDDSRLRLRDVDANDGWTWRETTSDPRTLALVFTAGDDTLEFHASLSDDATITARVDRPVITPTPSPSPAPSPDPRPSPAPDADHDDDDHDDDDHDDEDEDDDHEGHEHEGHDDDD